MARHPLFSEAYDGGLIQGQADVWHADMGDDDGHARDHVNAHDHENDHGGVRGHARDHENDYGHDDDGDLDQDGTHLCRNLGKDYNLQYESQVQMRPCLLHDGDGFLAAAPLLLQNPKQLHDIYKASNSYDYYLR